MSVYRMFDVMMCVAVAVCSVLAACHPKTAPMHGKCKLMLARYANDAEISNESARYVSLPFKCDGSISPTWNGDTDPPYYKTETINDWLINRQNGRILVGTLLGHVVCLYSDRSLYISDAEGYVDWGPWDVMLINKNQWGYLQRDVRAAHPHLRDVHDDEVIKLGEYCLTPLAVNH